MQGNDAMKPLIYFRLGDRDRISLGSLLAVLRHVRGLLEDFDATVSKDPRGMVRWEVEVLQKSSPALLGVVGVPVKRRTRVQGATTPKQVEAVLMDSTAGLSLTAERSAAVSDSAMQRYEKLARQTKRIGEITVYTDEQRIPINEETLENIGRLIGKKHESHGSILGKLETISVHRRNEIRVWDENLHRPVTCEYPDILEETVKSFLRERVLVSGVVSYNKLGQAISMKVATIDRYPRTDTLPSIQDMVGLVDDVTGGRSLAEYLEHLRDG